MMPLDRPKTGIKMKDWSLKYTASTLRAALLSAKPDRIPFMPMFITEPMDAMTVLGKPTATMAERSPRLMWKINPTAADTHCPTTVAMAAPETPICGKPR